MGRNSFRAAALLIGLAALPARRATAQTTPAPDTTRLQYGEENAPARLADAPLLVQRQARDQWKLWA